MDEKKNSELLNKIELKTEVNKSVSFTYESFFE